MGDEPLFSRATKKRPVDRLAPPRGRPTRVASTPPSVPVGVRWSICAVIAVALLCGVSAWAVTPLSQVRYTPEVTTVLGGTTVGPADVANDNLAGAVSLVDIGSIPSGAHLDGYAVAGNGDQLLSFDTALTLGGATFQRNDVIRYNGSTYTLEFSGGANGVPDGVDVKEIAVDGANLLLSFDSAFAAGGVTFYPYDVAEWNGAVLTKYFDGGAAGVPDGVAIDGLDLLPNGHLLFSFDSAAKLGGLTFDHEDIAEYTPGTPGTWEYAYVGAASQPGGWGAADLTAFDAVAGSNTFDVALALSGPATVGASGSFAYTVSVTNLGPQAATALSISDPLPAGVLFQALAAPAGWSCTTPAVGANGTVLCTSPTLAPSLPQNFAISVSAPGAPGLLSDTATVTTNPSDTQPSNNAATVQTNVVAGTVTGFDIAIAKTATPWVAPGGVIVFTVVVTNNGPDAASNVTVSDPLPAGVLFQNLSISGTALWLCTVPVVGTNGTISCSTTSLPMAAPQTITIDALAPPISGSVTNTATAVTNPADQSATNNASSAGTQVGQGAAIPLLGPVGLAAIVLLLGWLGCITLRRAMAV
jgi:uncharacterized repeat protein (TIGR01451 family)